MMFKRSILILSLLSSIAVPAPLWADDLSQRVDQLDERIRQLTGQIEQLNYEIKQLQTQRKLGAADAAPQPTEQAPAAAQPRKLAAAPAPQPQLQDLNVGQGTEVITDSAAEAPKPVAAAPVAAMAPATGLLGAANNRAAQKGDGGFQGKVLVAPNGVAASDDADAQGQTAIALPASAPGPGADTPEALYSNGNDALLKLQYADAEASFKALLAKYPSHALAGSAGFWLGETYWAEQNFADAARAYQDSYQNFPKGRRAPDSMLKLGLSLSRLGQKDQACTIITSVDAEYPSAVDVKKKAQAAARREGCS